MVFILYEVEKTSEKQIVTGVEVESTPEKDSPLAGAKAKGKTRAVAANPLALNHSIWEMDQKANISKNYNMLELYAS